jgi:hypothetical protein
MVQASEDVGGSPAFEFTLPEITIADGEFNAGAAVVHVDLSVSGSVKVALPGHVEGATLTADELEYDAQQSLHGLTAGLQVSGLGSEAVGISGTYGNEYSQSSYSFEDGSMVYQGQCKISYSWSCPHGQVEVEGSGDYTLKIKVMPGDSGTEETEEELGKLLAIVSVAGLVAVLAPQLLPVAAAAAQQAAQAGQ